MISKGPQDIRTSVSISYSDLPRGSLHYLEKALRDWITWHRRSYPAQEGGTTADTCSGTLQYCPELVGRAEAAATGLAYVDKPTKPQHVAADCGFNVQYERVGGVPKYDYISEMPLDCNLETTQGTGRGAQRTPATMPRRQSRCCFNCGSFLHGLKDCPEARDAGAIAQARRDNQQGRLSHGNERYFTAAPDEFADLRPGVLSADLRMALGGLASADPPPWLHRMRELGYPPGYMSCAPEHGEQNGLVLHDDTAEKQSDEEKAEHDEADLSSCSGHIEGTADPAQRQRVAYPGINAPVPTEANQEKWGYRPSDLGAKSGQMPPRKRMRTEPPRQAFSATPQYAPHYEPDAQAWSPQPHHGFYGPNPDPWMQQQGYATPSVAYPGGQQGSIVFNAPSLQPDSIPDSHLQDPGMGYPECASAPPSLPQYGQIPQLFGAGVLQQEIPPPPPLPPEIEDQSLPLPPLPPDSGF
ncbi:g11752 [Coccomyxa viridis]|uniref:G11752 protein n=1 Tax=Coccomyxa viridis TaxID=1274662 RepID=A0ABP1G9U0_9CHLO